MSKMPIGLPLILPGSRIERLSADIAAKVDAELGSIQETVYKTGALRYIINTNVKDRAVYIIRESMDDPWRQLAAVCLIAAEVKHMEASSIIAVIPDWRIGHDETGLALAGHMLAGSGVDALMTLSPGEYPLPVIRPQYTRQLKAALRKEIGIDPSLPSMSAGTDAFMHDPVLLAETPCREAEDLARALSWEYAENQYEFKQPRFNADIAGRDVLIYANELHMHRVEILYDRVMESGAASCRIFAAEADLTLKTVMELMTRKAYLYTFSRFPRVANAVVRQLDITSIIADTIIDHITRQGNA